MNNLVKVKLEISIVLNDSQLAQLADGTLYASNNCFPDVIRQVHEVDIEDVERLDPSINPTSVMSERSNAYILGTLDSEPRDEVFL